MWDDLKKQFESLTREEKMKTFAELTEQYFLGANDDEKGRIMMNIMPNIMSGNMGRMRTMCQSMMPGMFGAEKQNRQKGEIVSCCSESENSPFETQEIKSLFEDWVSQVQEEIERFRSENPTATNTEIAQYLKISEKSLAYFIKNTNAAEATCRCGGPDLDSAEVKTENDFETIKLEKTKNICPMCENYAKEQKEKPVVVMSCEGACLRGEISRRAANTICHELLPDKTVRLCLGGAFTKDGGQRNLVKNAHKVVALEGCFIKCASRMMKGVVEDLESEIIITDQLFEFDTDLFGINEISEQDIKKNAEIVANKIAKML